MKKKYGIMTLFIFFFVLSLHAKVIYVNVASANAGVGDFWHSPLNNLTSAIEKAQAGDQIWVAKGVYSESIVLKEGVEIYGGFAGTESALSMRDFEMNETTLNGDFRGRVVSQLYPFAAPAVLDGFIITGGLTGLLGISSGAGAYISAGGVLRNCHITGNRITGTTGSGAGVFLNRGGVLDSCVISANEAAGFGGGVALSHGGTVTDCSIYANKASSGGGIYVDTLNHDYPTKSISLSSIEKYNVFTAGDDGINTYRIPAVVVTRDGSILAFCEARKNGWQDHDKTAVVVKRSTDCGKTWSEMITVASDNYTGAYADPCPVVDYETGEIFVLMNYWRSSLSAATTNTAWLARSNDDGVSWSLKDVSSTMVASGCALQGVGVGSGIQMRGKEFSGRLIIPTRQIDKNSKSINNRTVYSDDHGKTWHVGQPTQQGGEHEIAEAPLGTLVLNQRSGTSRITGRSVDGGQTWSNLVADGTLFSVEKGCQASLWGNGSVLLFCGPKGGSYSTTMDDRCNLTLARSLDGGKNWSADQLLYRNGSGYSSLASLPDGRICILFESGDSYGFIRTSAARPAGWMRLDLLILPKETVDKDYWFTE